MVLFCLASPAAPSLEAGYIPTAPADGDRIVTRSETPRERLRHERAVRGPRRIYGTLRSFDGDVLEARLPISGTRYRIAADGSYRRIERPA